MRSFGSLVIRFRMVTRSRIRTFAARLLPERMVAERRGDRRARIGLSVECAIR